MSEERFRPIYAIAGDIRREWRKVHDTAEPYLKAMETMRTVEENYGADPGYTILTYFLSNAQTFRGGKAKQLKIELKDILAHYRSCHAQ